MKRERKQVHKITTTTVVDPVAHKGLCAHLLPRCSTQAAAYLRVTPPTTWTSFSNATKGMNSYGQAAIFLPLPHSATVFEATKNLGSDNIYVF